MIHSLLFHVSHEKVDIIEPKAPDPGDRPCICMSEGRFISYFGEWIYIFDWNLLARHVEMERRTTGGVVWQMKGRYERRYSFVGRRLEQEWRIYDPIPVQELAIGVVEDWNYTKGKFMEWLTGMATDVDMATDPGAYGGRRI